jgi:HAD superfamily hydrolase (TIGR01509 family)
VTAAVMFDCDGVLVDSEPLIASVLVGMANELGGGLTDADGVRMFRGAPLALCAERIAGHLGRPVPPGFAGTYRARSAAVLRSELTAVDGVADLIACLTVPTCVVSNSARDRVLLNLTAAGLRHHFGDSVFSACDVARFKPAPDVYLHAADRLAVDPAGCVAIEDTATGVRSAAAAGMTVVGYAPPRDGGDLRRHGASRVCSTMREVREVLADRPAPMAASIHPSRQETP